MSVPAFAVFSNPEDPATVASLRALLAADDPEFGVQAASTLEAAIASNADVLIFIMEDSPPRESITDLIPRLKERKVIGIGYAAAQLFGRLGLEINGGACAHYGTIAPKIKVEPNDLIPSSLFPGPIWTVQLSPEEWNLDHFAMYVPRYSHLRAAVDVIARPEFDENYAPLVRQGNYVMIGIVAPPQIWTPDYRELFRTIAVSLHERKTEPFSRAQWDLTKVGIYNFRLAEGQSTQAASSKHFYFRFSKPTTFSAILNLSGSNNMMLLFMGEKNREHWTREDAQQGEALRITIKITEEDIRNIDDWYWSLHVTNFDPEHPADCSLTIEYLE